MVHYSFVAKSLIVNLTGRPITSYNRSGGFCTIPPSAFRQGENIVYIVDEKHFDCLTKFGIANKRLFFVCNIGKGRCGVKVCHLMTADKKVRLMPEGE